jgi:hypothetical protein
MVLQFIALLAWPFALVGFALFSLNWNLIVFIAFAKKFKKSSFPWKSWLFSKKYIFLDSFLQTPNLNQACQNHIIWATFGPFYFILWPLKVHIFFIYIQIPIDWWVTWPISFLSPPRDRADSHFFVFCVFRFLKFGLVFAFDANMLQINIYNN